MRFRPGTLFLLLILFVAVSADRAWACGNGAKAKCGQASSETSCSADQGNKSSAHCADKKDACAQNHPGQKCPGSRGCGGCHCPCGVVAGAHAGAAIQETAPLFSSLSSYGDAVLQQAFYFAERQPEAVYLPIWQPPKLAA